MKTAVVVPRLEAQSARKLLEKEGLWDRTRRLQKHDDNGVAIPVTTDDVSLLSRHLHRDQDSVSLIQADLPPSKTQLITTPAQRLKEAAEELLKHCSVSESRRTQLTKEIPARWERHGDLVLLPAHAFASQEWSELGQELWAVVAKCTGAERVARQASVTANGYRTPQVTLLLGDNGIVQHVDNEIRYEYDITRCMFSAGNITEKLRIANFNCERETVVDLYAGIGYFTLPYLVHADATHVHACEWNPDAVAALRRNLELNNVLHRCSVYLGDNRQLELRGIADRVNLGLIPSSEEGWPVASRVLKPTGGMMHIHGNVNTHTATCEKLQGHRDVEDRMSEVKQWDSMDQACYKEHRNTEDETAKGKQPDLTHQVCYNGHKNAKNESGSLLSLARDDSGGLEYQERYNEDNMTKGRQPGSPTGDQSLDPQNLTHSKMAAERGLSTESSTFSPSEHERDRSEEDVSRKLKHPGEADGSSCCGSFQQMETDCSITNQTETSDATDGNTVLGGERQTSETAKGVPGWRSEKMTKTEAWKRWGESVCGRIKSLLEREHGGCWQASVTHIEQVKSYAPHIHHIVLDVRCAPLNT